MRRCIPLLLLILDSCATFPAGGSGDTDSIVIRNRSGEDIDRVSLREAGKGGEAARFGSVSPVPKDASQEFVRPTKAGPLPRKVLLEWRDSAGRPHVRELALSGVLKEARQERDDALVFEIGPFEDVQVMMEHRLR